MQKLKLDLDVLEVASFETASSGAPRPAKTAETALEVLTVFTGFGTGSGGGGGSGSGW